MILEFVKVRWLFEFVQVYGRDKCPEGRRVKKETGPHKRAIWYSHCNTLQHTAIHCNTLQHTATHDVVRNTTYRTSELSSKLTATHCNTLQHTATHCNSLQHTAIHCNTLQHTMSFEIPRTAQVSYLVNSLQLTATNCNTLQHTATHCNTLQYTATHCNTRCHSKYHVPHKWAIRYVYVLVYILMYIYVRVHRHTCICVCVCGCVSVCVYINVDTPTCVYMWGKNGPAPESNLFFGVMVLWYSRYMSIWVCACKCVCVCIHVHVYMCACVYIHTYRYTRKRNVPAHVRYMTFCMKHTYIKKKTNIRYFFFLHECQILENVGRMWECEILYETDFTYIYIKIWHSCKYVYINIHEYVHVYIHKYICVCVCAYIRMKYTV